MPDFPADAESSGFAKIALRDRLLATRRSLTTHDRRSAAARVQAALVTLVRTTAAPVIAAYVPVGAEPGGDLPGLLAPYGRVLLPVLLPGGDLDWVEYAGSLESGPRGLLQPAGPRLGVAAVAAAGLVVVPALAVDRRGMRLGRGGGSYDRALARVPAEVPTVALLHDGELLESVPTEQHDRPVGAVITPSGGLLSVR